MLNDAPLPGWEALHGGSPRKISAPGPRLAPGPMALVVDAADMDLPPGSIRRIDLTGLEDRFY